MVNGAEPYATIRVRKPADIVAEAEERKRALLERTWDEGFAAGANHDFGDYEVAPAPIENPYRKADRA